MSTFVVNAVAREDQGKGASRRLRHQGLVPAIIYGAEKDPVAISVNHNELAKHLEDEAFYSHILTIDVAGSKEKAILKDLQRHPAKPVVMHADFMRIDEKTALRVHVPVHFVGEDVAPGIKAGGVLTHNMNDVEVQCLPKDLPEFIEADVSTMEIGQSVHLSELKLPKGVELVDLMHGEGHDLPVATLAGTRAAIETTEEAEEPEEGGEE
jgi:large subunit ribosomal protein L25